jgi:lipid A 4'-phosphatase
LWRRRPFLKLSGKAWLFLFLGLLIGPGFVANVVFKDHWGRARPREVVEFGGTAAFSPAFYIRKECSINCSFVSGDASFGFYLPAFAFVAPSRRSRRVFWSAMALGSLFAAARVIIGAHFLSDILFAAFFMLIVNTLLHSAMFGRKKTAKCWKNWMKLSSNARIIKQFKYR